jgi:hypothetical protein
MRTQMIFLVVLVSCSVQFTSDAEAKPFSQLTEDEQHRAENMLFPTRSELDKKPHEVLQTLEQQHCKTNGYQRNPEGHARKKVVAHAVKLGADGVANLFCHKGGHKSLARNCFAIWTCTGDAIRWVDPNNANQSINSRDNGGVPTTPPPANLVSQLKELKALYDSGALSDEEFAAAKSAILEK